MYDSKGAKVHYAKFTITGIYTTLNINLIPDSAGVYAVVVTDANGERLTVEKIVVY